MFNIGLGEIVFIALLALIFIGPERLPRLMRQLGEVVYQLRLLLSQFNREFAEELKPLQEIQALREELNPVRQIGNVIDQVASPGGAAPGRGLMPPPPASGTTPPVPRSGTHPMTSLTQARQAAAPGEAGAPEPAASTATSSSTETAHEHR
jgi:sec-independent protein translocase protein TatB